MTALLAGGATSWAGIVLLRSLQIGRDQGVVVAVSCLLAGGAVSAGLLVWNRRHPERVESMTEVIARASGQRPWRNRTKALAFVILALGLDVLAVFDAGGRRAASGPPTFVWAALSIPCWLAGGWYARRKA